MDTHHRNANPGSHPRQNPRRSGALNCKSRYGGAGIARSEPGDEMSCSGRAEPGDRDPSSFARALVQSKPYLASNAENGTESCGLQHKMRSDVHDSIAAGCRSLDFRDRIPHSAFAKISDLSFPPSTWPGAIGGPFLKVWLHLVPRRNGVISRFLLALTVTNASCFNAPD